MRRVDRSIVPVPISLQSARVREARREVEEILILPIDERRQRRAPYNARYIQSDDVREGLAKLFLGKCAYCESERSSTIDHFRPVHVSFDRSEAQTEHYYSWLAYDWGNLYLVCDSCNLAKRNQFPIYRGFRAPLLSSLDEIRRLEKPKLVDPCYDDPSRHLDFFWNGEVRGRTERGSATISCFALNRADLIANRHSVFLKILEMVESDVAAAAQQYQESSAYSGAIEDLLWRLIEHLAERLGLTPSRREPVFSLLIEYLQEASRDDAAAVFTQARNSAPPQQVESAVRESAGYVRSSALSPATEFPPAAEGVISEIAIRGYKAIRELTFSMPSRRANNIGVPCLMLIGENACGKSSVLEAIALTLAGGDLAFQVAPTPSDLLRRKGKESWALIDADPVEVKISFHGSSLRPHFIIDPVRLVFEGDRSPATLVLGYGPRRFFLNGHVRRLGYGIRSLFDASAALRDPSEWLSKLSDRNFFPLARALREILNLNAEDSLVRDEGLGVCVVIKGQRIPIERMSEGYKSLFALAVDIMRQLLNHWRNLEDARGVVLIDEIETHLHPRWKMRVMSGFRRALPGVTFIVTTHDPLCLRGMDDGEVHVLMRGSDLEIEQLNDLPSLKGMRADQILTSDYFGLSSTADPEIEAALAEYAFESERDGDAELERTRDYLSQTVIGTDSAALMLVEEAVKKYLDARSRSDAEHISEAKKGAIETIVDSLERISRGKQ